jgi:hypothetical protein
MRSRERRESGEQDMFRSRLDQVINMDNALVKLARTIDWRFLEEKFGSVYKDGAASRRCRRDRGSLFSSTPITEAPADACQSRSRLVIASLQHSK